MLAVLQNIWNLGWNIYMPLCANEHTTIWFIAYFYFL